MPAADTASQPVRERALTAATRDLAAGRDLDRDAATEAVTALLDAASDPDDVAAFLAAHAAKGPTGVEVAAAARVIRDAAVPVDWDGPAIDIVGCGGDGSNSINISTIAALIAASAGATVAKVGNRATTSQTGSADLLEGLGVPLGPLPLVAARLRHHGFAFLFSPAIHPALGRIAPIRRRLGFRTLFNLAGPLSNPIRLSGRLIGAGTPQDQEILAEAAAVLGVRRTWIVRGHGNLDELTTGGVNDVIAVDGDDVTTFRIDPAAIGLAPADRDTLRGGNVEVNTTAALTILAGAAPAGRTDTCLLNAAAALHLSGHAIDIRDGLARTRAAVFSGAAGRLLLDLRPSEWPHPVPAAEAAAPNAINEGAPSCI